MDFQKPREMHKTKVSFAFQRKSMRMWHYTLECGLVTATSRGWRRRRGSVPGSTILALLNLVPLPPCLLVGHAL